MRSRSAKASSSDFVRSIELMIQRLRAVGERGIERARILLEDGLQVLGAVDERGVELQELVVELACSCSARLPSAPAREPTCRSRA